MTEKRYVMVFDAGTGAGRCFITDLKAQHTFSAYKEWSYHTPEDAPGGLEFDPSYVWRVLCQTAKEAMIKGRVRPDEIMAVSSTSQREGIVLLDRFGKELYAGPNMDTRAINEQKEIVQNFGDRIYQTSGHFPILIFAPCRLEWLKKHRAEIFGRISHLLMINDWILYKLSGEYFSEPTNACETALFDIHDLKWSWKIIDDLNLPSEIFSDICLPGQRIGTITAHASEETGLNEGTPVIMGAADTQCGLLGSGVLNDNEIGIVAGTTTPVQMVTPRPCIDPEQRMWTNCYILQNKWILESNAGATGIAYRWFRDAFCPSEQGADAYELMDLEAESVDPGSNALLAFVGPGIMNARSISRGIGGFITPLPATGGKNQFIRAILENMAFAVRANIEQITEVAHKKPTKLKVCGGSSRSKTWLKVLANVTNLPVYAPRTIEASAAGAAVCASVGASVYSSFDDAVKNMVNLKDPIIPNTDISKQYNDPYKRWKKFYKKLSEVGRT